MNLKLVHIFTSVVDVFISFALCATQTTVKQTHILRWNTIRRDMLLLHRFPFDHAKLKCIF